ncbi:MAG: DNRLRE domain-containing protein [Oscillospiraceae bacterium]|jgi:hypothetical protein|nr:DNRLRE domain-containing protein [Oscillospiraceae bacterium]
MKRFITVLLCSTLALCAAACSGREVAETGTETGTASIETAPPPTGAATEKWSAPGNTAAAWFSEEYPQDSVGNDIDTQIVRVGKNDGGEASFALMRLPLRATWFADEVTGARLFLKIAEGAAPSRLKLGAIPQGWDAAFTTLADARAMLDGRPLTEVEVNPEADGWISVPATEFVKDWLGGAAHNYGLAIFGDEGVCAFVSGGGDETETTPYFSVDGTIGARADNYGKFGYAEAPPPGAEVYESGNCMSYALRDTDMILIDALNADFGKMNEIYTASGEDAVAEYFAGLVMDYVETNKEGLRISNFRRIDGFDAEIDPKTEYRVALRVGCKVFDGKAALEETDMFDYHFWAQIADGRWAQKFPQDPSEIIPCSAPDLSPGKYPWDCALMWYGKTQDYYTSEVVYFAAAKDTDEFTSHMGESAQ